MVLILGRKEEKDFDINVKFEEVINLRKYIFYDNNRFNYELIGVISNINGFREEKHYIAFCKSFVDKKWYLYEDDSQVIEVKFKDVKEKGKANILFYNCMDSN